VMNGDATPPVAANMSIAAHFGMIPTVLGEATASGVILALIGGVFIGLGLRKRRKASPYNLAPPTYGDDSEQIEAYETPPTYQEPTPQYRRPAPPEPARRTAIKRTPPPPGSWEL
jgi:hypothetical protein